MNTNTFKKHLLTLILILFCGTVSHATDDLITQQITIKLDAAGTLSSKIGQSKRYLITNLKIVGEINGTDLAVIRAMAGRDYHGNSTSGNLTILDLSEATIVEGGTYYSLGTGRTQYTASNNELGDYIFYQCDKLNDITLPSSVTTIGGSAFEKCSGLTSITIPSSVTSIGGGAFSNCSGLTNVTILSSVTSIGGGAFGYCSGLTSITISPNVSSIDSDAFWGSKQITVVRYVIEDLESYLPKGHGNIKIYNSDYVCEYILNGTELTNLIIPEGVTSIGGNAFYKSKNLTSVTIPSSVTSIDMYAFKDCSGLTSVTIPSSITSIGMYAYEGCSGLTSVYVSWTTPIDENSAFYGVYRNCTLYIPQGTYQDYWLTGGWGDFGKIVEFDATGIDKVSTASELKEVSRYSVNGQRLSAPAKGVNILKYSDGRVKKVAVR